MDLDGVVSYIKNYTGEIKIMEVCGTHTSSVFRHGIKSMLPGGVRLVSGPGCPVCVTPRADINALVRLSERCAVCSFGDMIGVPGTMSLADAKARGGDVRLIYSPFDVIKTAAENPRRQFIVAAAGFETTAPVYAALAEYLVTENIRNVRLYTSLKTIPEAVGFICQNASIGAFICPGHVAAVIGYKAFGVLCRTYRRPFVVAGFTAEHILAAIYEILRQKQTGAYAVKNLYPSVVNVNGQIKALAMIDKYFIKTDAAWRGVGVIKNSGYKLRDEYAYLSANDNAPPADDTDGGCRCADVYLGKIEPPECGLFGTVCVPENPVGACMTTPEGACRIYYQYLGE